MAMMAAAFCVATQADTLALGYNNGRGASGDSPVGFGADGQPWIESAVYIPASTMKTLRGTTFTGIAGWIYTMSEIEDAHVWLRTDLEGEDLAAESLAEGATLQSGRNDFTLSKPWTVPADFNEGLYIGFGQRIKSANARGLAVIEDVLLPGGFFLKKTDGKWYDYSDRATACVEAIVEGTLPQVSASLKNVTLPSVYVSGRGAFTASMLVQNTGSLPLAGMDVTADFGDGISETVHVDNVIASGLNQYVTAQFTPTGLKRGTADCSISISNFTLGEDVNTEDNSMARSMEIAETSFLKKVLVEEFTGEMCGKCPDAIKLISEMMEERAYRNIVMVSHHAGYLTDFLTTPFHTEFMDLFGGGSYAPALAVDRAEYKPNIITFVPDSRETIAKVWDARLAEPGLVSVNIEANWDDDEHTIVRVKVYGEKAIDTLCDNPVINVFLLESDIQSENQTSAPKDFKHNHVSRAVNSRDYWGAELEFDGDTYSYTTRFRLDPAWNKDNMDIVAFIGNNGNWIQHTVANTNSLGFDKILEKGETAVQEVESAVPVLGVEYYNLQGIRVNNPSGGMFVRKTNFANGTSKTEKVLVK